MIADCRFGRRDAVGVGKCFGSFGTADHRLANSERDHFAALM